MSLRATSQDAQPNPRSSGRRRIVAAASPRSAAQPGTTADMQQEQEATKSSQETARVAQALVSKASNQQREGDAIANRQGLVQSWPEPASPLLLKHFHLTPKKSVLLLPSQWQRQDHDDVDNNASAAHCDVVSLCRPCC